ncbi:PssE/Cps14G family polysaccharide biosynthesis glycosyltransferase [Romboutsia sp.]|uniref:PssE/Cps14G family polysaccharide biosynthesis glycosyltransferase n=1 Tax=Romboutsia sp. TaxID=1965302 RepID=UPI003F39AC2F
MIFVTLGTHELPFNRLLNYIDKLDIKEEVIIQFGNTEYESKKYKVIKFMNEKEFNSTIDKSDLVICHGGVGTILAALRKNKKVIVVPRLSKYKEHNDDHQLEITQKFAKNRYILDCVNFEEIKDVIKNYKTISLNKYPFENRKLINFIDKNIKS